MITKIQNALELPPRVLARKVIRKIQGAARTQATRVRDRLGSSFLADFSSGNFRVQSHLQRPVLPTSEELSEIQDAAERSLEHYFNLLGSGQVQVRYGMTCRGVEGISFAPAPAVSPDPRGNWLNGRINSSNLRHSQRIWSQVDPGYMNRGPIDWQLDFKSGFRWNEGQFSDSLAYGNTPGVDVKVPWELSRMQHLVSLALADSSDTRYLREFENQVLDFIALNPPRFGVNWRCAMDVGIRVANWLIAYDLFAARKADFRPEFLEIFTASIRDHAHHIAHHLEWYPELRSNHYLGDIAGLLFAAACLPSNPQHDTWLAFAIQEWLTEIPEQFYEDGSNFEASTCYHRLSAEMAVYSVALITGLSEERTKAVVECSRKPLKRALARSAPGLRPLTRCTAEKGGRSLLSDDVLNRVAGMSQLPEAFRKANGEVTQIGDNDSGRFLKLEPGAEESVLNHDHLIAAVQGLIDGNTSGGLDGQLTLALAGSALKRGKAKSSAVPVGSETQWAEGGQLAQLTQAKSLEFELPDEFSEFKAFPEFGAYVFKSERAYLSVRCGPVGQNGNGGHAHQDQLAIELMIDGKLLAADPGTYLYTPLPARRNAYRSVEAHCAPRFEGRILPGLDSGLFRLSPKLEGKCLYFGPKGFLGVHQGYGTPIYRRIEIAERRLIIQDYAPEADPTWRLAPIELSRLSIPFSPGYGKRNDFKSS